MKFNKGDRVSIEATVLYPGPYDLVTVHIDGFGVDTKKSLLPDRLTLVKAAEPKEPPVGAHMRGERVTYFHLEDGWRAWFGRQMDYIDYDYDFFKSTWDPEFTKLVHQYWEDQS